MPLLNSKQWMNAVILNMDVIKNSIQGLDTVTLEQSKKSPFVKKRLFHL